MSDELKLRMIKVSNNEAEPSADADAVKERHKLRGWTGRPTYGNHGPVKCRDGSVLSDDNPVYWWCAPEEKDFPTLYQFMKENPREILLDISKWMGTDANGRKIFQGAKKFECMSYEEAVKRNVELGH